MVENPISIKRMFVSVFFMRYFTIHPNAMKCWEVVVRAPLKGV